MSHKRIGVRQDIEELVTSAEADKATPLMTKIYYRLLITPSEWWEGSEELSFRGSTREGVTTTAWDELVNWLRVSPEEARKAIHWLHEKQIINYREHEGGQEIKISFVGLYFPG